MTEATPDRIPSPCPCCGAYALPSTAQPSALLAVCDVLVVKALEQIGRKIVNGSRARQGPWRASGQSFSLAHTVWPADEGALRRGLEGAWDVVPAMLDLHGCCGVTAHSVVSMLDEYVRDLAVTGTRHDISELHYRFTSRLGLTFPASTHTHEGASA